MKPPISFDGYGYYVTSSLKKVVFLSDMDSESFVRLIVGDVVKATVKYISKTYAELCIGDIIAYLPSSEYSWERNNKLKDKIHIGDDLQVVVIQITESGVMVSIKRMTKDPWYDIESIYHVNQQIKGKVIKVFSYGAFVKIAEDIQGFLYKGDMSLDGKKDPNDVVSEGQEIDVVITSIERNEHKLLLAMRTF